MISSVHFIRKYFTGNGKGDKTGFNNYADKIRNAVAFF